MLPEGAWVTFQATPSGLHRHMTPRPVGMTSELTGQTISNHHLLLHIDLNSSK